MTSYRRIAIGFPTIILALSMLTVGGAEEASAACRVVDVSPAGLLGDVALADGTVIDTDTGDITNGVVTIIDGSAAGVSLVAQSGGPPTPPQLRIYDFRNLTIPSGATVLVVGTPGLALLASETISIAGTLDASGGDGDPGVANGSGSGGSAGPGGYAGGEFQLGIGCPPGNGVGEGPGGGQEGGCGSHGGAGTNGTSGGGGGGGGAACGGGGGAGGGHATLGDDGGPGAPGTEGQPGAAPVGTAGNGGLSCVAGPGAAISGGTYGEAGLSVIYGGSGGASGGFGGLGGSGGAGEGSPITAWGGFGGYPGGPAGGGGGGGAVLLCATTRVELMATGAVDASGGNGGLGPYPLASENGGTATIATSPVGGGGGAGRSGAGGSGGGGAGGSILVMGGELAIDGALDVSGGLGNATRPSGQGGFGGLGREGGGNGGSGGSGGGSGFGGDGGDGYVLVETVTAVGEPFGGTLLRLGSPRPNPMVGAGSRIEFTLPKQSSVELEVYDLAGRRVAEISSGSFEPGTHARSWNGKSEDGRPVAAGVYILRLKTPDAVVTRKMAVLD